MFIPVWVGVFWFGFGCEFQLYHGRRERSKSDLETFVYKHVTIVLKLVGKVREKRIYCPEYKPNIPRG